MKHFTLKDFIAYNSPCFSCGELMSFQIMICPKEVLMGLPIYLKASVNKDYTTINLHIGWDRTLRLTIDHKTNKFFTNNTTGLKRYLRDNWLSFSCYCNVCQSHILSDILDFNLNKEFVKSTIILTANIIMK